MIIFFNINYYFLLAIFSTRSTGFAPLLLNDSNTSNYEYLFKIILIGNSGVGKSSILQRYMKHVFDENYKITIGVDFLMKSLIINNRGINPRFLFYKSMW